MDKNLQVRIDAMASEYQQQIVMQAQRLSLMAAEIAGLQAKVKELEEASTPKPAPVTE